MLQADAFWPTILYYKDIENYQELNSGLERDILAWSQSDPGLAKTNRNGWHSTTNMHTLPEYKKLVDVLFEMQHEIYAQEALDSEPILGNMWANINYAGGYNAVHVHPNCLWSGVYYVKTPKQSGNIFFEDPRTPSLMTLPKRTAALPVNMRRTVEVEPKAGRIIMFPAWLNHGVLPNESNEIRISVAFNFLQKVI